MMLCKNSGFVRACKGRLPSYDLLVHEQRESDKKAINSGILFVTNRGKSATDALRRLLVPDSPVDHRILVTDEERNPLTLKRGTQAFEYYRDLAALGAGRFEHIKLDFEQYAALDAIQGVVNLALSGDLEIEIPKGVNRRVTAEEVVASHHRRDLYRRHPLLRPMLTEDPAPVSVEKQVPILDEKDVRSHIMAQLSWRLGMTAFEATKGYLNAKPALTIKADEAKSQVKTIAGRMRSEKLIHATPHDDDLFLQRRA